MKTIIDLTCYIQREDGKEISEENHNEFLDGFVEFLESRGYYFNGFSEVKSEKELSDG